MHVLIVGGNRFVGHQLVWRLLAGGHRVTTFNRGSREDGFGKRIERLIGDRTTQDFGRLLEGRRFDAAVDFAAFTGADARSAVSVLGGGRVGHYVFISTGQVYLVRKKCPWPAREADYEGALMGAPPERADRENWIYGVQKRDAEDVLTAASAAGFPATRLRIPMVNGERDYFRRVEGYLWRLLDGGPLLVPDGGTAPMCHVYGGDVVRAIIGLLGNASTFGQVYNLSQDESPSLAELLALLAECLGAPPRLVPIRAAALVAAGLDPVAVSPFSDPWMSRLDASKAKAELAFRPEPLPLYLDKIITSFLDHPPAAPPDGYARRDAERRLAARSR